MEVVDSHGKERFKYGTSKKSEFSARIRALIQGGTVTVEDAQEACYKLFNHRESQRLTVEELKRLIIALEEKE